MFAAIIIGTAALPVAALTYFLAKRREHEYRSAARADELLNELLHAIRSDIDPSRRSRSAIFIRFLSAPPATAS
jgi:DNA-binding transcriptional regulator YbjK